MEWIAVLRYAKAFFDIALEKNMVEEFNTAAAEVLAVLNSDKELMSVINHLSITADEKMVVMTNIFGGKVPEDFLGIFSLIFRRGRQRGLPAILARFEDLYKEHIRVVTATLYSPALLPQTKLDEIGVVLGKKLGKTIEFTTVVDPSLIAGFKVVVDGRVFDSSLKNQLGMLKRQLLASNA